MKGAMHMTADSSAGAASHLSTDWHAIPWKTVHETVRRLQARIVQATKAGKWHKVQALQHLLTHALSGKALAVRRVTANQGKNTPGIDKVIWKDPESKGMALHQMQQRGYKALPLRRGYIPKSNGKKRPLGIPMCPAYCISLSNGFGNGRRLDLRRGSRRELSIGLNLGSLLRGARETACGVTSGRRLPSVCEGRAR